MYWGWHGMGWGGMLAMMLLMIIFWGGLLVLIGLGLWAVFRSQRGTRGPRDADTALRLLQERYARGEITREQYEQMRRDIGA